MDNISQEMIKNAIALAGKIKTRKIFIHIDPLEDLLYEGKVPKRAHLYLVSRKKKIEHEKTKSKKSLAVICKALLTIPRSNMTRASVVKIASTLALSADHIQLGDKIVWVTGRQELGHLDQIQILDTSKETELVIGKNTKGISETVQPEVFQAILSLAIELADKGREGKPVGTIFVVGDHETVLQLSKQMIINPFKGYDDDERNIIHSSLKETIREFAAMDGAFVISDTGVVITAGRYLSPSTEDANLSYGLGARHFAAAGITSLTKAIAFAISESSGDVRVFKNGKLIMEIEKPSQKR